MCSLSQHWFCFQLTLLKLPEELFPDGLTPLHQRLVWLLDLVPVQEFVSAPWHQWRGRPEHDRRALARAFLAKALFGIPTTRGLLDRLRVDGTLRRLCGWEMRRDVPSEATFSRAFTAFAKQQTLDRLHEKLVKLYAGQTLFWHVSRDSTAIPARERPAPEVAVAAMETRPAEACAPATTDGPAAAAPAVVVGPAPKRKRGRPRKGEQRPVPPPTRLQQQYPDRHQAVAQLRALPARCDWGAKKDAAGNVHRWKGYKLHVDVGDGGLPLLAVTTSASLHDSQAAIPMARLTAQRITSLYDLMDSAYDAELIWQASYDLGHTPIIAENRRRGEELPQEPDRAERYKKRSGSERFNALLKDQHGGRTVRVRGRDKVHTHLMCGVVAIFVAVLAGWAAG